ncbi:DUF3499 family protein [Corynebacterium falsenii]|uniref:DUF3499 family protein n=1 Tax=Corynebacterium falsenii TaxID=108486 RepID=UPI003FCFDC35
MTFHRPCSRPGCHNPAVATLTYDYAQQIATVGPLHIHADPHRWDLCAEHARRTTVPVGWTLEVNDDPETVDAADADDDDLMALAQAVQEAAEAAEVAEVVEPEPTPSRIVRRVDVPAPTGRHPSRRNLPTKGPRRHLRAVRDTGPAGN